LNQGLTTGGGALDVDPGGTASLSDTSLTVAGWVKATSDGIPVRGAAIGWSGAIPGEVAAFLSYEDYGSSRAVEGRIGNVSLPGVTLADNLWHHVALTWNHTTGGWVMYVNGSVAGSGTIGSPQAGHLGEFLVHARAAGFFNAPLDEVGFWLRVLSVAEILALYNNGQALDPTA
jgi:hypothetical protein